MDQTLETLTQALKIGDAQQRREIAGELGRRGKAGDLRVIPILIDLLHDEGSYVDEAASDALWSIGAPAVPALSDLLNDRDLPWLPRQWAARTFMYIGDPRAAGPMAAVVLNETEDPALRRIVAGYLGNIKTGDAFDALVAAMTDPGIALDVRVAAIRGLGEMRDSRAFEPLAALLRQEDIRFMPLEMERELRRIRAMQASASSSEAEQMADMIKRAEPGRSLHNEILTALRYLHDPRTIDLAFDDLRSDDDDRQGAAAAAIGDVGEPAIDPLLSALRSDNPRLRAGAALALGYAEDPRATKPLAAILLGDPAVGARRAAAFSLGFIKDDRVAAALISGLRDEDMLVRQNSVHGLYSRASTGHADLDALPALEWIAGHDPGTIYGKYPVREAATRAIREIRRA